MWREKKTDFIHMIWYCPVLKIFWSKIFEEMYDITGTAKLLIPKVLLGTGNKHSPKSYIRVIIEMNTATKVGKQKLKR